MPRAEKGEAATGAFKELISAELVRLIARHLDDPEAFEAAVVPRLPALEMKARVEAIRDALLDHLPEDVAARHARLRAMLHPEVRVDLKAATDERAWRAGASGRCRWWWASTARRRSRTRWRRCA